jgi:uncharacterized protein
MPNKTQRIRDPLHDIIPFDAHEFEDSLWRLIQTPPFQRMRRIRQLGFSELTFPGTTHTRFAHSIGVFHTARHLMNRIHRHIEVSGGNWSDNKSRIALAAALVHDVGHGMFSHAFEDVGKKLNLGMMRHEDISEKLIRDSELTEPLKTNGGGFADDVATLIGRNGPATLYDAVVSSQFDADRLDYMRRDRLMAGVQSGGIDFSWLLDNLEIGPVNTGVDDTDGSSIDTFVLGPKSVMAAEQYVLALFQLYPTIYYHKTTRAVEKMFSALMTRVIQAIHDGQTARTGLPDVHPIVKFAKAPEKLETIMALDDSVFWGALGMMAEADEKGIEDLAIRMRDRRLPKVKDIRLRIEDAFRLAPGADDAARIEQTKRIDRVITNIELKLTEWHEGKAENGPRIFIDKGKRDPYSRSEAKGPFNKIHIKDQTGNISDIADHSPMIAALKPFEMFRAYVYAEDSEARDVVEEIVGSTINGEKNG